MPFTPIPRITINFLGFPSAQTPQGPAPSRRLIIDLPSHPSKLSTIFDLLNFCKLDPILANDTMVDMSKSQTYTCDFVPLARSAPIGILRDNDVLIVVYHGALGGAVVATAMATASVVKGPVQQQFFEEPHQVYPKSSLANNNNGGNNSKQQQQHFEYENDEYEQAQQQQQQQQQRRLNSNGNTSNKQSPVPQKHQSDMNSNNSNGTRLDNNPSSTSSTTTKPRPLLNQHRETSKHGGYQDSEHEDNSNQQQQFPVGLKKQGGSPMASPTISAMPKKQVQNYDDTEDSYNNNDDWNNGGSELKKKDYGYHHTFDDEVNRGSNGDFEDQPRRVGSGFKGFENGSDNYSKEVGGGSGLKEKKMKEDLGISSSSPRQRQTSQQPVEVKISKSSVNGNSRPPSSSLVNSGKDSGRKVSVVPGHGDGKSSGKVIPSSPISGGYSASRSNREEY